MRLTNTKRVHGPTPAESWKTVKKIVVGFNKDDGAGMIVTNVKIGSTTCPLVQLSASGPALDCVSGKYITMSASADTYPVYVTYSGNGINGPYTKTEQTTLYKSD